MPSAHPVILQKGDAHAHPHPRAYAHVYAYIPNRASLTEPALNLAAP